MESLLIILLSIIGFLLVLIYTNLREANKILVERFVNIDEKIILQNHEIEKVQQDIEIFKQDRDND